jgi:serine/threonine protein kinase
MHTANLVHRDLKPANILLTSDCTVRVCDFGFSRTVRKSGDAGVRPMSPVCFSRYYRPPEIILPIENYDTRTDIWSFGCVVSEIISYLEFQHEGSKDQVSYLNNRVLFEGNSCYPFSPLVTEDANGNAETQTNINSKDQILVIMRYMDPEKELRQSFFESDEIYDYYKVLLKQTHKKKQLLFEEKHPGARKELVDLLHQCLIMDPEDRCSIDSLLSSSLFDNVRIPESESNA